MSDDPFDDEDSSIDEEDGPIVSARNPELARRMENVRQRAEQADAIAKQALELVNKKNDVIEQLEARIEELEADIDDLREQQSLLQHVNSARDLTVDERSMVCLQTLYHDASDSDSKKAYMTVREGWTELGRSIPRPRVYDVFERAETLVDDDSLCWYQKEPRGSDPPSRLMLDLSDGDLPRDINGHVLRRGKRR